MGIALICVLVVFVLFAVWNKVHRRSFVLVARQGRSGQLESRVTGGACGP